jgi:predicted PurR-regulated permease PerM
VTGDGQREPEVNVRQVRLSVGSVILVIGAVVTAVALANLFQAARRPVAWTIATAIVAWLLTGIIDTLDRRMPRALAVLTTVLGFVALVAGAVIGIRATIRSEVDKLRTALPTAAHDLEQRYSAAADFHLAQRTQSFVTSLDDRFGVRAQVAAAAGTASTYVVTGVLTLFLLIYGPRFVSAALRQITDPARRASVTAAVYQGSNRGRAYLLVVLAQTIAITAVCSAVFYLLDLPAPFVLAMLVGWLGTIPFLGIILGGLAPLLAAATELHDYTYPVLFALLIGLQLIESLLIRPLLERRTIRVGPTLMLVGNLIGFELYGIGGAIYTTAALVFAWAVVQATPDHGSTASPRPVPGA